MNQAPARVERPIGTWDVTMPNPWFLDSLEKRVGLRLEGFSRRRDPYVGRTT